MSLKVLQRKGDILGLVTMGILVLVSRLPFLDAGYGTINDSWRVAYSAQWIATTGHYLASRFPPHPVQEFTCSLLWTGGPFALNGMTAIMSVLATVFFALSLKLLKIQDYIFASLALAYTPVIYINSTSAMDYVWALAFLMGSLYYTLTKHYLIAGMLLGLAIGCRITSGAMILPLIILIMQQQKGYKAKPVLIFSGAACLVGAITFLPVLLTYRLTFLTFSEAQATSPRLTMATMSLGTWGTIGTVVLVVAIGFLLFQPRITLRKLWTEQWRSSSLTWACAIFIYVVAFLRLPHQSGYLVPIVPFVILILQPLLPRRMFLVICFSLIASSFISIRLPNVLNGPILVDYRERRKIVQMTEQVIGTGEKLPGQSLIVAGHWLPRINVYLFPNTGSDPKYTWLLDRSDLEAFRAQGYQVYYLPGVRQHNLDTYHVDLLQYGAIPLLDS